MKKHFNIIISLIIFFIISLISVYTSQKLVSLENILLKQIIFYIIGSFLLISSYHYKKEIIKYHYLLYIGICFLLLILLFLGISINGSKCWFIIGPVSFQPSEFMKISLILTISILLTKKYKNEFTMLLTIFIITFIPAILTFLEPDTGVVIIYLIIMLTLILKKGINKKWYLIFSIILIIFSSSLIFLYLFNKDYLINLLGTNIFYRLDRLINWSNQNGYQLENSLITIGSSGLTGFGFNKIPLYFPEASTDFIFTTFSSLFGFMGDIVLIIIIIFFDISIINLTKKKISKLDKNILTGFIVMIIYQQIQNISMTLGLLPITGITLPFISYGGSSLLSYMFILGIILRINDDEKHYINKN